MKYISMFFLMLLTLCLMSVSAFAENFTPSVEQKGAPNVVFTVNQLGNEISAVIKDDKGQEIVEIPYNDLIITPISKANDADENVRIKLQNAYSQIKSAETLNDLTADVGSFLKLNAPDVNVEDLVIKDLFNVSLSDTYADYITNNNITVTFKIDTNASNLLMVLDNYDGNNWRIIPESKISFDEDENVVITFDSLSSVAFVVDGSKLTVDPNAPLSPQTGVYDRGTNSLSWCAALFFVFSLVFFIRARKYKG